MRRCLILLAVLILGGCATDHTQSESPVSHTPSLSGSAAGSPSVGSTTRPCTKADLPDAATLGPRNGAAGTTLNYLRLVNRGDSRCTIAGYATLVTTDASGRTTQVPADQGSPFDPSRTLGTPATIDSGQPAQALVTSSMSCNGGTNPTTYANLSLLVSGVQIAVPGLVLQTTCPLRVGAWYRPTESGS